MDFRELAALGAEPTPSAIAPFIVQMLERHGATSRSELIAAVESEWASAGGKPIAVPKTTARVKKALAMLQEQGIAENPTYGYYRLAASGQWSSVEPSSDGSRELDTAVEADEVAELEDQDAPDVETGYGSQALYAFYLPTYRRTAEMDGHKRWPMKVGMTTTSVAVRMAAHRTALPEVPNLALVVRTENAALLEKVVHGVLTLRGQRSEESGGAEWFLTNVEELVEIYRQVVGVDGLGTNGAEPVDLE